MFVIRQELALAGIVIGYWVMITQECKMDVALLVLQHDVHIGYGFRPKI